MEEKNQERNNPKSEEQKYNVDSYKSESFRRNHQHREQEYKPQEPERPREDYQHREQEHKPQEPERSKQDYQHREQEHKPQEPERSKQDYQRKEQEYKPQKPERPKEDYQRREQTTQATQQQSVQRYELWQKIEKNIVYEESKLSEVNKLYLRPDDTYSRYLKQYNRSNSLANRIGLFTEEEKQRAEFMRETGKLLNSRDENERKLGVLRMIYNDDPAHYYRQQQYTHAQEILTIALATPELQQEAEQLSEALQTKPFEAIQNQLKELSDKVVKAHEDDMVIDTLSIKLQNSIDNYNYFKELNKEKLSQIDDVLQRNWVYSMEISSDLYNIEKIKSQQNIKKETTVTPQEIARSTYNAALKTGIVVSDAYRTANRYDNSALAGKAVLEVGVIRPLSQALNNKRLINESIQATTDNFVNTIVTQILLDMPVYATLKDSMPSDLEAMLSELHKGLPTDAKGKQEYLDRIFSEHSDIVEKTKDFVVGGLNKLLKKDPELKKKFENAVLVELSARGGDSKLLRLQVKEEINARLKFGGLTVTKVTLSFANSVFFLEQFSGSKNYTDQIELLNRGVILPMIRLSTKEFTALINTVQKKTNFFDMFKDNRYVASVATWIGNSTKWMNLIHSKYYRLFGNTGYALNALLHADKPSDIVQALAVRPAMNIVHRVMNRMLRAVGRMLMRILRIALKVVVQIVAVVLPYALMLALILLPVIIIASMFLSPVSIDYETYQQAYILDEQPAMKIMQNILFGSKYGINDISVALITDDQEEKEKIKQIYQEIQTDIIKNKMHPIETYSIKKLLTKDSIANYENIYGTPVDNKTYTVYETETATYVCTATADNKYEKVLQSSAIDYTTTWKPAPSAVCESDGQIISETILKNTYTDARLVNVLLGPMRTDLYINGRNEINKLVAYGLTASTYYATVGNLETGYMVDHTSVLYDPNVKEPQSMIKIELTKWIPDYVASNSGQLKVEYVRAGITPLLLPVAPKEQQMRDYYSKYAVHDPWTNIARAFTDNTELFLCNQYGDIDAFASNRFLCVPKKVQQLTINPKDFGGVDWRYQLPLDTSTSTTTTTTSTTTTSSVTISGGIEREYITIDILNKNNESIVTFNVLAGSVDIDKFKSQDHTEIVTIPLVQNSYDTTLFEIYYSTNDIAWAHIMTYHVPVFINGIQGGDAAVYMYWK